MNQFVPDWSNMGDTSRPLGEDDDLIELLWCNGHVVMQSQTHRKVPPRPDKAAAVVAPPPAPASVPQEDEGGLWFPFALADSLDKDIFSDFFYEAPAPAPAPAVVAAAAPAAPVASGGTGTEAAAIGKPCRDDVPAESDRRVAACPVSEDPCDLMPPPKSTPASCSRQQTTLSLPNGGGGGDNAGDLSDLVVRAGKSAAEAAGGASSMLSAIGSSICGSNQVLVQRAVGGAPGSANANAVRGGRGNEASSSGRSDYCFGTATATTTTTTTTTEPTSTSNRSSKRKRLDTEDSESPSEDAESESAAMLARKPPQKMTTARRSRAAEVHNLSERRRRDRINEKMRAPQTVVPANAQVNVNPVPGYRGHHMPPAVGITEPYGHYHLGVNHLQPPPSQHYAQGVGYYPPPLEAKAVQQQTPELHHVPGPGATAKQRSRGPGTVP